MTEPTAENQPPATAPTGSGGPVNRGAGSLNAPRVAVMLDVEGDLQDDVVFRRFVARQFATQTLSQQRAEWSVRSIRLHVMAAFWLGIAGAIVGSSFWPSWSPLPAAAIRPASTSPDRPVGRVDAAAGCAWIINLGE